MYKVRLRNKLAKLHRKIFVSGRRTSGRIDFLEKVKISALISIRVRFFIGTMHRHY